MDDRAVRILLVEDNPGDARLLRETLRDAEDLPHELTHAERLGDAIARLSSGEFDVLLLDMSLPDSRGIETIQRVVAEAPAIPVVVLTGTDDQAMGTEAVRLGAQDYLVKGQTDHRLLVRAMRYAIERKRSQMALANAAAETARQRQVLAVTLASIGDAVITCDTQGRVTFLNGESERLTGWKLIEAQGQPLATVFRIINERSRQQVESPVDKVLRLGMVVGLANHTILIAKDGRETPIDDSGAPIRDSDGTVLGVVLVFRDFSENKRAEGEREAAIEFLHMVNTTAGVHHLIEASVRFFRKQSGCEAVGIRLRDGEDYPYYETHGFPEQFVRAENSLCTRCENGDVERDSVGNPVMACMCGNVICGRFDPTKPFFTAQGSFWANDTTRLLATTTDADRQARTRNRCNGEGYESVALIALRMGDQRMGLLQLNDRRKNMFTPESIALWERLAGYLAVALAQAKTEESLRQSEERYRELVENANSMIIKMDGDGHIAFFNDCAQQFFGYSLDDVFGRDVKMLVPPVESGSGRGLVELVGKILKNPDDFAESTNENVRKNGERVWVSWRNKAIRGPGGEIVGNLAIGQDITARRQAELDQNLATEALRLFNRGDSDLESLIGEVLRLIRDSAGFDAVGLRLRQGDDCPYYQQDGFSKEFLREENFLCARSGDGTIVRDACGRPVLECTCGLVLSGKTDPSMPCFTERGSFWTNHSPELLALPPEADPRTNPRNRCIHVGYESVALMPVRCGEQIIGLLQLNDRQPGRFTAERIRFFESLANNFGLAVQRRRAEEELKAAKLSAEQAKVAAEEASKAKDHFLAVLSHELRTPLSAVIPALDTLAAKLSGQDAENLEMARRNVELEARLIDDLLDVTRIARGKIELDRKPIELCTVIRRAAEVCMPDIEARQLHFGIDVKGNPPHWVNGDPARLQQVFWNLIKNAVKFTPHGGCVGVHVRAENGQGVVEIVDSGHGIEADHLPLLFNAFEQAERSITRQFGGLGLGLAISKALVELHGGTIGARSGGRGRGATFIVRLPILERQLPIEAGVGLATANRDMDTGSRKLRILLVEDHGDTARIMRQLLRGEGHEVRHAGDTATAMEMAVAEPFDLLLSDLGLPDASGHDLLRALRKKGVKVKAIALSGYGMAADVQKSREAGFDEHITKPVNFDGLVQAIHRVVGTRGS